MYMLLKSQRIIIFDRMLTCTFKWSLFSHFVTDYIRYLDRLVSFPDRHAIQAKDGLEWLHQILDPSVKRLFHSKSTFFATNVLFKWKRRFTPGPRI